MRVLYLIFADDIKILQVDVLFRSEDVTKLIPSWKPWWEYYQDGKIEDLGQIEEYKQNCPEICTIKSFVDITV